MGPRAAPILCLVALACRPERAPAPHGAAETLPAFGAASGVTYADPGGAPTRHRIVPLRPMSGDAEVLYGDPEKPGQPFVMRIRELPGTRIPLHSHPVDEHITVVQGTWYFAVGERWDSAALHVLTPGTYAFAPAGSTMFAYSPDGAVVQVHGVGPFHIRWREGLVTLDDRDGPRRFRYRKGERIEAARGSGTIRQGYSSGAIVQYEVQPDDGGPFMVDEAAVRRR